MRPEYGHGAHLAERLAAQLGAAEAADNLPPMAELAGNVLYYGDNLDVLRR